MNEKSPDEEIINRWRGLIFVIVRAAAVAPDMPAAPDTTLRPNAETFQITQKWSDEIAMDAAKLSWTNELSRKLLNTLSESASDFGSIPQTVSARRAERLVLALDRLTAALPQASSATNQSLNKLFADAQSLPDFDPQQFAKDLNNFHSSVAGFVETK